MEERELRQLRHLILEKKHLEEELDNLPVVKDSVKGSMVEHPYIMRVTPIEGVEEGMCLRQRIEMKCNEIRKKIEKMENWLDEIEDSEIRDILRLRYCRVMTWSRIAFKIGHHDEQYPRKRCKAFFEEQSKNKAGS